MIDVLIVRMVVAPAVMTLLGDRAWSLPPWLDRVLPHLELEGDRAAEPGGEPADAGERERRRAPRPAPQPAAAEGEG